MRPSHPRSHAAAAGADVLTLRTANRRYSYVSLPLVTACSLV
jgi:hypothetical protein